MINILLTSSNTEWDEAKKLAFKKYNLDENFVKNENGILTLEINENLVLINGGMGLINAAATLEYALNKYDAKNIIVGNIIVAGIAGSIDPDLELGDIRRFLIKLRILCFAFI